MEAFLLSGKGWPFSSGGHEERCDTLGYEGGRRLSQYWSYFYSIRESFSRMFFPGMEIY